MNKVSPFYFLGTGFVQTDGTDGKTYRETT